MPVAGMLLLPVAEKGALTQSSNSTDQGSWNQSANLADDIDLLRSSLNTNDQVFGPTDLNQPLWGYGGVYNGNNDVCYSSLLKVFHLNYI